MELKRYVLLDDNKIIEKRFGLWIRDTDNMVIGATNKPVTIGIAIKSSDNILDLREENDILIVKFNDGFFDLIRPIFTERLKEYETPIALLKKLPNGDYKRYEVLK